MAETIISGMNWGLNSASPSRSTSEVLCLSLGYRHRLRPRVKWNEFLNMIVVLACLVWDWIIVGYCDTFVVRGINTLNLVAGKSEAYLSHSVPDHSCEVFNLIWRFRIFIPSSCKIVVVDFEVPVFNRLTSFKVL